MARACIFATLFILLALCGCRSIGIVSAPTTDLIDGDALLGVEDYWKLVATHEGRHEWLESQIWFLERAPYDILQSYGWMKMTLPNPPPPTPQPKPGILNLGSLSKPLLIDLKPGIISCVQTCYLSRQDPDSRDAINHVHACCVVERDKRQSRVVIIPGSWNQHAIADQATTVLEVRGAAFTGLTYDEKRHRIFVLDAARFEVWRIDDSDGDRIPDLATRGSVVGPDLFKVRGYKSPPMSVAWVERDGLKGLMPFESHLGGQVSARAGRESRSLRGRAVWADTNDDGVMDQLTTWMSGPASK